MTGKPRRGHTPRRKAARPPHTDRYAPKMPDLLARLARHWNTDKGNDDE